MDNASTFNGLMNYLPNTFYYISVDLPGHGRSSHFPSHLPIHSINYILVYKILTKFFKREKYIIMGHSYGGQLGLTFSQMHPECVEKIILFDTITFLPVSSKYVGDYLVDKFDSYLELEEKLLTKRQPTYTFNEALDRIRYGRNYDALNESAARALIERAIEPTNDGRYRFTLDPRLKFFINPLRDFRYINESLKTYPVKCPILIILANESTSQQVYMRPVIGFLKKWKNVKIEYVDGTHDVHNTYPERVAPLVVNFLLKQKGKM